MPGFASERVDVPLDLLVIGNAHAGTVAGDFRDQWSLADEIQRMDSYYRELPDKSYHQQQVRLLLEKLNRMSMTWVFTVLVKCFVWNNTPEAKRNNVDVAIGYCKRYLQDQLRTCVPKVVVSLGRMAARELGLKNWEHGGEPQQVRYGDQELSVVTSMFPSAMTANRWIQQRGWEPVLGQMAKITRH